ncbi:hypothetical protein BDP81DRAFT_74102 [Colletotrichum phormii]|uniref:Uncharacterized protein n=1 Tax=Colletotrichum phormii TaxID=359342 RepID=A0AAJ0ECC9_9PEZI|nr:uncharacterized protein BDP81DRAFT_74102 [Colletotrichum phormii]KAK1633458.1 hypothetical protein BDP81DRAFT_74102 [Colletotrichum phormii]
MEVAGNDASQRGKCQTMDSPASTDNVVVGSRIPNTSIQSRECPRLSTLEDSSCSRHGTGAQPCGPVVEHLWRKPFPAAASRGHSRSLADWGSHPLQSTRTDTPHQKAQKAFADLRTLHYIARSSTQRLRNRNLQSSRRFSSTHQNFYQIKTSLSPRIIAPRSVHGPTLS